MSDEEKTVPIELRCTITQELLYDPVVAADGHTYERAAIVEWLKTSNRSPNTNEALQNKNLVPNVTVRGLARKWAEENGVTIPVLPAIPPPAPVRAPEPASEAAATIANWRAFARMALASEGLRCRDGRVHVISLSPREIRRAAGPGPQQPVAAPGAARPVHAQPDNTFSEEAPSMLDVFLLDMERRRGLAEAYAPFRSASAQSPTPEPAARGSAAADSGAVAEVSRELMAISNESMSRASRASRFARDYLARSLESKRAKQDQL